MTSSSSRVFPLGGSAWQRVAAGLFAVVGCGFLAPTALAGPPPAAAAAPIASASSFDAQAPAEAPTATTADPETTATTDQSGVTAPADTPPADPVATAMTDQGADSTASATQQQPVNLVVIVRVDSPGNNGPITQQNVAVAPSIAANDASTAQSGGSAAASTSQQATPTATATQDGAGNYVITVRIDSAGSNGAVSQTNGVVGASSGTNTSDTAQQVAAPKPAVQPQARRAGAARSPKQSRVDRQPSATAEVDSAARRLDPVGVRPARRHPAGTLESRDNTHHQSTLSRIAQGAAQALSPILPQAPPAANAAGPADVSRPVLLTLLVLAAAMAAFALVRRAMPGRAPSPRPPR